MRWNTFAAWAPIWAVAIVFASGAPRSMAAPAANAGDKPVVESYSDNVPKVLLSGAHAKLCTVHVGDVFPSIELPKIGGGPAKLDELAGKRVTVVVFWTPEHWMSRVAFKDAAALAKKSKAGDVALVGVVEGPEAAAGGEIKKAGAEFPQLLDADGAAFAQVGSVALPRVYVLDAERKIAWFDIEYSESTRRELAQTLAALTAKK